MSDEKTLLFYFFATLSECDNYASIVFRVFSLTQDVNTICLNEIQAKVRHNFLQLFSTINTISSPHTADPSLSQTIHFPYQSASSWLPSTLFCLQTSVQSLRLPAQKRCINESLIYDPRCRESHQHPGLLQAGLL